MSRLDLSVATVALAVALGAVAIAFSHDDAEAVVAADPELDAEVARLRADLGRTRGELDRLRQERRALESRLGGMDGKLAALAAAAPAQEPSAARARGVEAPVTRPPAEPTAEEHARIVAEFEALRPKVMSGNASADELQRFLDIARGPLRIDNAIVDLEARVERTPTDADARMELAQAYLTKLLTIPGGPEQGVWGMKAESQWKAVLEHDPDHWDARYSLAESWTQWPEFTGKTPAAVREFETLLEVQGRLTPDPRHARTYLHLHRLYLRQGKLRKATDVLRQGRERHPDDEPLRRAAKEASDE